MPSLVVEESEIDLLLSALDGAIVDLQEGRGPSEDAKATRRRPVRTAASSS